MQGKEKTGDLKKMAPVTGETIGAWKEKYGVVFAYEVDGNTCYLRRPDRKILGAATMEAKGNPIRYNEIILKNCWLGEGKELLEDDAIFYGLSSKVDELVDAKVGELKKV